MKRVLVVLMVIATVSVLGAYSLLDLESGNRVWGGGARLLAMGEAGVSKRSEPGALNLNPALGASLSEGISLQLNGSGIFDSEDRSIPMYNFFDGYIDDANYSSNTSSYYNLGGRLNYVYNMGLFSFSAGAGWQPVIDFGSDYIEQVRNDGNSDSGNSGDNSPDGYPPIIARNYLNSDGSLGGLDFMFSASWNQMVNLGFSLQQLSGDWEMQRRIEWTNAARELAEEDLPDYALELEGEFDTAYRPALGLNYQINDRLGIAFAMHSQVVMDRTVSGMIDTLALSEVTWEVVEHETGADTLSWQDKIDSELGELIIPADYRIGFEYHPRNMWETFITFDLELVEYSEVNSRFSDVYNFYLGVEHQVNQKLPMRFGFNYKTGYYIFGDGDSEFAQKVTMPGFTAGTGFELARNLDVDLGLEYSLRKYEDLDLFGDSYYDRDGLWNEMTPVDRDWDNPDQVNESLFTLQAAITWHWQVK